MVAGVDLLEGLLAVSLVMFLWNVLCGFRIYLIGQFPYQCLSLRLEFHCHVDDVSQLHVGYMTCNWNWIGEYRNDIVVGIWI